LHDSNDFLNVFGEYMHFHRAKKKKKPKKPNKDHPEQQPRLEPFEAIEYNFHLINFVRTKL